MNFNLFYISPELILVIGGMLTLIAGVTVGRCWTTPKRIGLFSPETIGMLTLLAALVPSVLLFRSIGTGPGIYQFSRMMAVDGLAIFFKIIGIASTAIVLLLSVDYFKGIRFHRGEYYALLVFAALAITSLAASTNMVMIYLSLEFLSLTSYILAGYVKQDPKSNEASIKYFLYGSIAGAIMIYGMSMLYGLTGTTDIVVMGNMLHGVMVSGTPQTGGLVFVSVLMVLAGFGFKIAMVPFHQWSPDTYEGAPTPVTAFLSVGSKAAGFAVLIRVLSTSITAGAVLDWTPLIIVLSAITMTVGNLIAIPQKNIKRMLAYSSIAQAGYLLIGVATLGVAAGPEVRATAIQSVLLYIFAYLFMNLGAFAVVTLLSARLNSDMIRDYAGLVKRSPWAAVAMVFFLLSLAGIPPTVGFLGKFYLFYAAIQSGSTALLWLAVIAIVNTIISVYYYFNVVRMMFFVEPVEDTPIRSSVPLGLAIGLTLVATIVVLLFPQPFLSAALQSAKILGM